MIDKANFEKAKEAFAELKKLDCIDGDYTANKLQYYFNNYFASAFFVQDGDFKAYLNEDIKDIRNRDELMESDEKEIEFIRARVESTFDVYGQLIVDTEKEFKNILA